MRIAEAVSEASGGLALADICAATGLKTSTAHNLVRTLVDGGFLARTGPAARYQLGPAVIAMAARYHSRRLLQIAADHVLALHRGLPDGIVTYAESENNEILVRARAWPQRPGVVEQPEGMAMPAYTTVTSLVFQAFWPGDQLAAYRTRYPLAEYGAHLWRTQGALDRELAAIRTRGYALALRDPATVLVAAPVFGPGRDIVGVLGIRIDGYRGDRPAVAQRVGARLVEAATAVTAQAWPEEAR